MPLLYLENPAGDSRSPLAHDGEFLMLPIRVHAPEPPTPPTDDPIIPSPSPPFDPESPHPSGSSRVTRDRSGSRRTAGPRSGPSRPSRRRAGCSSYWRPVDSRPANGHGWEAGRSVIDPGPPTRRVRGMLSATPTACRAAWCGAGSRRPFAVPPRPNRWCRPYPAPGNTWTRPAAALRIRHRRRHAPARRRA
jgi:hypothetical protein